MRSMTCRVTPPSGGYEVKRRRRRTDGFKIDLSFVDSRGLRACMQSAENP
jgi:hypothetical protein